MIVQVKDFKLRIGPKKGSGVLGKKLPRGRRSWLPVPMLPMLISALVFTISSASFGAFFYYSAADARDVVCSLGEFQCADKTRCLPKHWVCDDVEDCEDGSDEFECGELKCQETEFQCKNGHHCIPSRWRCDGEEDCSDGSDEDEHYCKSMKCSVDQFTCNEKNGVKCLPLTWVCDGAVDCAENGEDEKSCNATCTSNEFTCRNGKCIVQNWVCDGNYDCTDKSDEEGCPPRTCAPGKDFMCKSDSSCILSSWRCDGEDDCSDGSDEADCHNGTKHTHKNHCGKQEFECADKLNCIHNSWLCDGSPDCLDGSDEAEAVCMAQMKCGTDFFQCRRNFQCIPLHLQCNGVADCLDKSDEDVDICTKGPNVTRCDAKTQFDCGNGNCIPISLVCNSVNDCGKWEDEPKDRCGKNECMENNGGCQEKCVDTPIGFYCECTRPGFRANQLTGLCEDIDECVEIPGACSQLCTNELGSYKCECLDGYLKDPRNSRKCKAIEGHASLLFALRHDIRKISIDHLKMTLIVENTRSATALDYMFRTGLIYWSDSHEGKIFKAPIDEGEAKSTVIDADFSNSDGLAIDWIYNHIYWTDSGRKEISVSELDGKMRKVLISEKLVEPRSIAVNPIDGLMFWTDWGSTPGRIERAGMDGSHRQVIVSAGLKWPNGLTLDFVHQRIFWVDAKLHSIFSSNYDGSGRRLVLNSPSALSHPFSITTFEDWIYWTDWTNETIFRANKFTGEEVSPLLPPMSLNNVMSVHVYHAYRQPDGENHCTPLNGRCSHLCLPAPTPSRIACACPDGQVLSKDLTNCVIDPAHRKNQHVNGLAFDPTGKGGERRRRPPSHPKKASSEYDIILAESGMNRRTQADEPSPSGSARNSSSNSSNAGAVLGIIIGISSALLVLILVVLLFLYRHYYGKSDNTMNFDNPVYRKTTTGGGDGVLIEKPVINGRNRVGGGSGGGGPLSNHKTYPATISEEATEPLTGNLGVNEYV